MNIDLIHEIQQCIGFPNAIFQLFILFNQFHHNHNIPPVIYSTDHTDVPLRLPQWWKGGGDAHYRVSPSTPSVTKLDASLPFPSC